MMTSRRRCLAILAAAALPSTAVGQPTSKHRLGILCRGEPVSFRREFLDAFMRALAVLGYVRGKNLEVEERYALATGELDALATDLVRLRVDAILTGGTPAT